MQLYQLPDDQFNSNNVRKSLLAEYDLVLHRTENNNNSADLALFSKTSVNKKPMPKRNFKERRKCHYCGVIGHLQKNCFKLKRLSSQPSILSKDVYPRKSAPFASVCTPTTMNFIFDSAATEHFSNNRDFFTEFEHFSCEATIAVGPSRIEGRGAIELCVIQDTGGHPYQWNSISEVCVSSLQDLLEKLRLYSVEVAAKLPKTEIPTGVFMSHGMKQGGIQPLPSFTNKVVQYFRNWPTVCYFFDELPNSKIRQIFSTSQPLVWMAEALGFLISASYLEDKFGVLQQMLPQIVCLLLDLKMAEEKLPIDPIGIKTCVRDPQDRYEHIHQRLALKASVNSSLCRIASAFKEDAKGIYLPDEYSRYFQRFINQKNA